LHTAINNSVDCMVLYGWSTKLSRNSEAFCQISTTDFHNSAISTLSRKFATKRYVKIKFPPQLLSFAALHCKILQTLTLVLHKVG